jgi:hypothetical protein
MKTLLERFNAKYKNNKNTGCWEWSAALDGKGYGVLRDGAKLIRAHRASYQLHIGEIPKEMCVCHKCDNPLCCNPEHLFLGNAQDNINDKVAKGRAKGGSNKGIANSKAKLSEPQVLFIRWLCNFGMMPQREIGEVFGVGIDAVQRIHQRITWGHI